MTVRRSIEDYEIFDGEIVYEDYYQSGQTMWAQAMGYMDGRLVRLTIDRDTSYPRQGHADADLWSVEAAEWRTMLHVPGQLIVGEDVQYGKQPHAWHFAPQFARMEWVVREILAHRDHDHESTVGDATAR